MKAPDSKSDVVARLPWVQIPPLPPLIYHFFTRWGVAKVYGDFVFANNDFVGDGFDDSALFSRLHGLPVVIQIARLGGNLFG